MTGERSCLWGGEDLTGRRAGAEFCGPSCKGFARRASAAFWGGLRARTVRTSDLPARPRRSVRTAP